MAEPPVIGVPAVVRAGQIESAVSGQWIGVAIAHVAVGHSNGTAGAVAAARTGAIVVADGDDAEIVLVTGFGNHLEIGPREIVSRRDGDVSAAVDRCLV